LAQALPNYAPALAQGKTSDHAVLATQPLIDGHLGLRIIDLEQRSHNLAGNSQIPQVGKESLQGGNWNTDGLQSVPDGISLRAFLNRWEERPVIHPFLQKVLVTVRYLRSTGLQHLNARGIRTCCKLHIISEDPGNELFPGGNIVSFRAVSAPYVD
ncbi:hypothetical protein COL922a_013912, partial [Colletotrichum nupharicola]